MRQDLNKELEQGKRDYERNFLPQNKSPVLEWIGNFWRGLLESNTVGLTPYGPKSRNYWLAKILSLLVFILLMLMILYCTLRTS